MEALGIHPFYLIAQVVNFLILFVLLKKFLYRPVLKVLDKRRERIKESLGKARRIDEEMKRLDEKRGYELEKAKKETQKIMERAKERAQEIKTQIVEQAHKESVAIKKQALKTFEKEKKKMVDEIKSQTAWLVLTTTKQVLKSTLDEKKQRQLIADVLEEMKKLSKKKPKK